MGKVKILHFCSLIGDIGCLFSEMFIGQSSMLQMNFILIPYHDWLLGPTKDECLKINL